MKGISARLAAASGGFYVVAILVGGSFMDRDGLVGGAGYALSILGFTAFVVFVGYVHAVLRRAEGPEGWVTSVALGAGLLHSAVRFAAQAPRMVEDYRSGDLSPELARTLADLNGAAFVVTGLLLGVYTTAAASVCLAHRLLPRWLGWFGVTTGTLATAASVIGMVDMNSYVPLPFLGGLLWTLVMSILLTVRAGSPATTDNESDPEAIRAGAPARA